MPSYYPIYLNLERRCCVVVGGGTTAERKVQGLLECGALVTVVSPDLTIVLRDLAGRGLLDWKAREYQAGDLEGAFLAVAATDNSRVHEEVAQEAEQRGVPLNVIDAPALCTFITPAVVRRGEVTFAVSTGGHSPALARRLREELEESSVLGWAELAEMVSEVRLALREKGIRPDPDRWQECMDKKLLGLFQNGQPKQARERLLRMLQEQPTASQGVHP